MITIGRSSRALVGTLVRPIEVVVVWAHETQGLRLQARRRLYEFVLAPVVHGPVLQIEPQAMHAVLEHRNLK